MGSLNVNRSVSDAFYRYKMPRIMAKVEGKGNGIKTVIVNMLEVAKALGRPATYPTKYFGCELGAQTQFDFKNDRWIVNGSHDAIKLQDLLDGFIRKFVLCPSCDNPETDLIVSTKRGTISQGCKACGFHGPLEFNHKLNTYILKNPPNLNPAAQGASLTEGKRAKRTSKKVNGENGDAPDDENDLSAHDRSGEHGDSDDTDWAVDCSEEAVRARLQDLTDGVKGLTVTDDLEKTEKERMDLFYENVKQRKDAGTLEQPNTGKELLAEAERLEIKSKAPLVLAELLFDTKILIEIKKHRVLLLRFTHDDQKAQKYLLGGVEQVIGLHKETLLPKVPAIFKVMSRKELKSWNGKLVKGIHSYSPLKEEEMLYDADILEEKVLLEWGVKVSKKYVSRELSQEIHAKAEPFITWLREAEEEEESSEDEEEDDLEIEYDDRAKATPLTKPVEKPKPKLPEEDGVDDVDIDAI